MWRDNRIQERCDGWYLGWGGDGRLGHGELDEQKYGENRGRTACEGKRAVLIKPHKMGISECNFKVVCSRKHVWSSQEIVFFSFTIILGVVKNLLGSPPPKDCTLCNPLKVQKNNFFFRFYTFSSISSISITQRKNISRYCDVHFGSLRKNEKICQKCDQEKYLSNVFQSRNKILLYVKSTEMRFYIFLEAPSNSCEGGL